MNEKNVAIVALLALCVFLTGLLFLTIRAQGALQERAYLQGEQKALQECIDLVQGFRKNL